MLFKNMWIYIVWSEEVLQYVLAHVFASSVRIGDLAADRRVILIDRQILGLAVSAERHSLMKCFFIVDWFYDKTLHGGAAREYEIFHVVLFHALQSEEMS